MDESTNIKMMLSMLLGICCIYDIKQKEIPLIPIVAAGISGGLYLMIREEPLFYLGGGLIGVICLLFAKVTKESFGYGDGFLFLALGLWMGMKYTIVLLFGGLLLSAIFAVFILLLKKGNKKTTIPFVPFVSIFWIYRLFT